MSRLIIGGALAARAAIAGVVALTVLGGSWP